jgi:hypothetical protein
MLRSDQLQAILAKANKRSLTTTESVHSKLHRQTNAFFYLPHHKACSYHFI